MEFNPAKAQETNQIRMPRLMPCVNGHCIKLLRLQNLMRSRPGDLIIVDINGPNHAAANY